MLSEIQIEIQTIYQCTNAPKDKLMTYAPCNPTWQIGLANIAHTMYHVLPDLHDWWSNTEYIGPPQSMDLIGQSLYMLPTL